MHRLIVNTVSVPHAPPFLIIPSQEHTGRYRTFHEVYPGPLTGRVPGSRFHAEVRARMLAGLLQDDVHGPTDGFVAELDVAVTSHDLHALDDFRKKEVRVGLLPGNVERSAVNQQRNPVYRLVGVAAHDDLRVKGSSGET